MKTENIKQSAAKTTAYLSAITAVAIIFSYVETLIPINVIPVAGFKLGLANIAVLTALYVFGFKAALAVSIARTVVVSLLFTGVTSMLFSLSGGILSLIAMWLILLCGDRFSICGVSVIGATFHNIGQLAVAMITVGSFSLISYLPFLMICSLITGIIIAGVTSIILKTLFKNNI